jgi:hypothetical protein
MRASLWQSVAQAELLEYQRNLARGIVLENYYDFELH